MTLAWLLQGALAWLGGPPHRPRSKRPAACKRGQPRRAVGQPRSHTFECEQPASSAGRSGHGGHSDRPTVARPVLNPRPGSRYIPRSALFTSRVRHVIRYDIVVASLYDS